MNHKTTIFIMIVATLLCTSSPVFALNKDVIGILLQNPLQISNNVYVLTGTSPFWEISGGFLQPNTTETSTDQLRASMFSATDNLTTPELYPLQYFMDSHIQRKLCGTSGSLP
jgi:hypothetical protein